jgi:nicotinate phosphoribosyltransferase
MPSALLADFYQLTMMQAYWREGMTAPATFDLFVRRLPDERNVLLACGLESALDYLEALRFTDADLSFLAARPEFHGDFLDYLRDFRFSGDVRAAREGTPVFHTEPLLEVTAPIPEAQFVETHLLNQLTMQTVLASKALRVVDAADGRTVADFGMRRMHGTDAALLGARAFYVAGVDATSNVEAGRRFRIPITGTTAHAYVEAHASEVGAFRAFADLYPETTLLVDTYDTVEGVRRVVRLADDLGDDFRVGAIRLDSGDLAALSRSARALLDAAGLVDVRIFASGGLDEHGVADLVASGAPIDGFGVGTRMGTSEDAPSLDTVYKLVAYDGEGRMKLSEGKATLPSRKQVVRRFDDGTAALDVIGLTGEALDGEPLLTTVMTDGARTAEPEPLDAIRDRARRELDRLPALDPSDPPYPIVVSDGLADERDRVRAGLAASASSTTGDVPNASSAPARGP